MRRRYLAALIALTIVESAAPTTVSAQGSGTVTIDLPRDDPFPAAPAIGVHAVGVTSVGLRRLRLRLALDQNFGLVVLDSIIAGDDAVFTTRRLLPENRDIYAQASVLDISGTPVITTTTLAGHTGKRLTLVSPNGQLGIALPSRQPRFAWRSAPVTSPPGPWIYELFTTNVGTQETRSRFTRDTVFTIPDTLQANTSYRWKVVARVSNGFASDSAVASSASSFTITPTDAVVATLLYQNFPNPFPAASSQTTCIWFDLASRAHVELSILDLRGNLVRTIVPGLLSSELEPGRYGRLREVDASGCDPRLAWDGTASNGRSVPPGVYLIRLKTSDGTESLKKIVYLGR